MSKKLDIDGGHGGRDGGANGFGVNEKDWTLRISQYQFERLKALGADVAMTRTSDVTLDPAPRTQRIRQRKPDFCISNHWNAFNGSAHGVETIHSVFANSKMATDLCDAIVKATGLHKRRVFSRRHPQGGDYYFMHRNTGSTQTTIIEYGFIDNRNDHNHFRNQANFLKAAEAVIEVMCKYLGVTYRTPSQMTAPKEKEVIELPSANLSVALQDLQFKANQWKTREVSASGKFKLDANIYTYTGSPNFEQPAGLLERGATVNFDMLAIPASSEHVWLRYRMNDVIHWLPFATIEDFNAGRYWGSFE